MEFRDWFRVYLQGVCVFVYSELVLDDKGKNKARFKPL